MIVSGSGGIICLVEGRNVKAFDRARGFVGAEAEPHKQSREAGGEYEAAAAPEASGAAVLRHECGDERRMRGGEKSEGITSPSLILLCAVLLNF